ncbi:MAG: hypothetical protein LBT05_03435 [Planctomycetaceae bacterium]|jgi:hypothetical protein|nr:hypothetical protein [Planctomycetaceae bacterium]
MVSATPQIQLLKQVTCPHCWESFDTEKILWISESPDLMGDSRLGNAAQQRFLPMRFNPATQALDANGFACHRLACPNCHLQIPRPFLEMPPFFISIVGAPAAGKSYYLASMTWRLRKVMPKYFHFSYTDADPEMNLRLQHYESQQFLQTDANILAAIEKTEVYGDIYNTVFLKGQNISFPQPFTFTMTPDKEHPLANNPANISKILCLYDNAGESYLPGEDSAVRPVTRHIVMSDAVFFLFDPTQDARFRRACQGRANDPQMQNNDSVRRSPVRQESILSELANRARNHWNARGKTRKKTPLVIVLTKADAWGFLLNTKLSNPWMAVPNTNVRALHTAEIENVSQKSRALLYQLIPEIVSAAEQLSEDVIYIPVSATGGPPSVDPQTGALGFRSADIKPYWVEVPILYMLNKLARGVIPAAKKVR